MEEKLTKIIELMQSSNQKLELMQSTNEINITWLIIGILVSVKLGSFSIKYTNKILKEENKFLTLISYLVMFVTISIVLIVFSTILSIFKVNIGINVLNFSALGIMFSVLLTMSYNFYIKESEKNINKLKNNKQHIILVNSIIDEIKKRLNFSDGQFQQIMEFLLPSLQMPQE